MSFQPHYINTYIIYACFTVICYLLLITLFTLIYDLYHIPDKPYKNSWKKHRMRSF